MEETEQREIIISGASSIAEPQMIDTPHQSASINLVVSEDESESNVAPVSGEPPTPASPLRSPLLTSKVANEDEIEKSIRAAQNKLFNAFGSPTCGKAGIVTCVGGFVMYIGILLALIVANTLFFSSNNEYHYAYWWQKVRLLYSIDMLSSTEIVIAALSGLIGVSVLFRLSRAWSIYSSGGVVPFVLKPFFLLSTLPMIFLVWKAFQELLAAVGAVKYVLTFKVAGASVFWSQMSESAYPALQVCFAAAVAIAVKLLWRQPRFLRLYDDGISLGISRMKDLLGERAVAWHQIAKVELSTPEENSRKDATLRILLKDNTNLDLLWKEVLSAGDPSALFAAIKTNVPGASLPDDIRVKENSLTRPDDSYTELWLKYFTTGTKRERTGRLEEHLTLCNGKYTVVGEIGAGGQGTAYLAVPAKDTIPGHDSVVLKEYIMPLHRGEALFQQSMKKLEQETAILQRIDHPQIVKFLDHFVEDHRGYLVMDFVEGSALKQRVQQEGPQSEDTVIALAIQICGILEYMHGLEPPVVHRDLTPDNLILQENGLVKLVDFNVAQQLESAATATVVGKHAFIPPEQFRGKPNQQSDIYAFGGTLHFLLTGADPEPLTPSHPAALQNQVSKELDDIIAKSTALDCSKRYASASAMKADLLALQAKKLNNR